LLENAAEAAASGAVQVCVASVDDQCQIRVVDRGPGISDSARSLERFETTKPGHLGLGLCMAQRIAARHGGKLSISSAESGAEVCLTLPLAEARNAEGVAMKRLLLVDDDESNRVTLSALLEDDGFAVDLACSFAEASATLGGSPPPYDAILLDHSLGDGYGSELIPLIRRVLPKTKVFAMSASAGAGGMPHAADAELPKGLHFPEFLERLQSLLSAPH
jgi:CheY-like chemotaxis protein